MVARAYRTLTLHRTRDMQPLLQRLIRMPPGMLYRKAVRRARSARMQMGIRVRASLTGTYDTAPATMRIQRILALPPAPELRRRAEELRESIEHYLQHRFDLLGSGWLDVSYPGGVTAPAADPRGRTGLSGRGFNRRRAREVWALVDGGYRPIDWQCDARSGFRWDVQRWHADIQIPEDGRGADVKYPWELARCQHMPQLALYAAGRLAGSGLAQEVARDFRNQVLDFVANNPPGYGVNWRCTMDVGIRAANWLVAFDLFRAAGATFDEAFERVLTDSLLDHARHACENLEWTEWGRSNHYLADVVSLLVMAAYLPDAPRMAAIGDWAVSEFLAEVDGQFDDAGANRESSTCYHRLGAELAIYGAAFACWLAHHPPLPGADRRPFRPVHATEATPGADAARARIAAEGLPQDILQRLHGMGRFVLEVSRPDGTMPQVGDNDSGRLFRISATIVPATVAEARARYASLEDYRALPDDAAYPIEQMLDHRHIPSALRAFFPAESRFDVAGVDPVEAALLRSIIGARGAPCSAVPARPPAAGCAGGGLQGFRTAFERADPACRQAYEFELPACAGDHPPSVHAFPEFGLFVLRHARYHLVFRCGPAERYGSGSHLHNDQLSLDAVIDGHPVALDPGTFVYTRDPVERRRYRSLRAHFAPWPAASTSFTDGDPLFAMPSFVGAQSLYCGTDGFVGRYRLGAGAVTRAIAVADRRLHVLDFSSDVPLERCPFVGMPPRFAGLPFSDRYGAQGR
jgi:hypothetical protein